MYDSLDGVRPNGLRNQASLNWLTGGDVLRLDVMCRRFRLFDGSNGYSLQFSLIRVHWILDVPRKEYAP